MATNAGFSAVKNYVGSITGLTPKSSQDGKSSQLAEAQDSYGDTIAHDVYGETIAPTVEFAVSAAIANTTPLLYLGDVISYTVGTDTKKLMLTTCNIKTAANTNPTVTVTAVEVESTATAKRKYAVAVNLSPRSIAQDVAGSFTASNKFTSIDTTFSVDPHVTTVGGSPIASDASHGKCEVSATMTDGDGTGSITAATTGGFTITAVPAESAPDAAYVTRTATATKFIAGVEVVSSGT